VVPRGTVAQRGEDRLEQHLGRLVREVQHLAGRVEPVDEIAGAVVLPRDDAPQREKVKAAVKSL
jgi:hypothetical protein